MIRTKICGIASIEDLKIAQESGTDAVGFLVGQKHNANGFISEKLANELCLITKPFISTVVVTHYDTFEEIIHLTKAINSTTIQIHSNVKLNVLEKLRNSGLTQKIICKVSIIDEKAIQRAIEIEEYADAILLDSIDLKNDRVGGTGLTHNWDISAEIVKRINKPIILAGGLNHKNVNNAIKAVNPWGVDANSGLSINHKKDKTLVQEYVNNAKRALL